MINFTKALLGALRCGLMGLGFICTGVAANDSSVGDDNGGIVLLEQKGISMAREHLLLSQERVEVDYTFINHGAEAVTTPVAFPMPPMYLSDGGDHSQIEDFKLYVDGKAQKTDKRLVILFKGKDVTQDFRMRGWNVAMLADSLSSGTVPAGVSPLPAEWMGQHGEPLFTVQEYFVWQQTFPAGKPVGIRHTYTPSLSSSVPISADDILAENQAGSCIDESTAASMRRKEHPEVGLHWSHLSYILTTGGNWKDNVIGDFTLQIRKSDPKEILSLCFGGDLRKIDPLTFEFSQKNYRPVRDLSLLFVAEVKMAE